MLEKIVRKRDLNLVDVYIEDSDATSKYFEVLESPQVLPPGRSSILINGSLHILHAFLRMFPVLAANFLP